MLDVVDVLFEEPPHPVIANVAEQPPISPLWPGDATKRKVEC